MVEAIDLHEGTNLWYETPTSDGVERETERHFPAMPFSEDFTTTDGQPGLLMVHAKGNVFVRELGHGEQIDVAGHSLVAWKGPNGKVVEHKPITDVNHAVGSRLSARFFRGTGQRASTTGHAVRSDRAGPPPRSVAELQRQRRPGLQLLEPQ